MTALSLRRWLVLARIPLVLVGIVLFFTFYNRFILDTHLKDLKSSLSVLDKATGVGQAEAALLLVDQTLTAEIAQEQMDLSHLSSLQYAQGVLTSDQPDRPVEDAQILLMKIAEEKGLARTGLLATLDVVAIQTQSIFRRVTLMPRQIGRIPISQEINAAELQQARTLERRGHLLEAAQIYEDLLKGTPAIVGQGALRLRLGFLYQRIQTFDKAEKLYREVIRKSREPEERATAQTMLTRLLQAKGHEGKAKAFEKRLATLGAGPERQRLAYELGHLWLKLYQLDKAAETFGSAAFSDPEGEWVNPSLFKQGWALKSLGRFDEALKVFQEVARRDPTGPWGAAAQLQIAEGYKSMGNLEMAVKSYEQVLKESKDKSLIALTLAHAGFTAMFELKDPLKATEYFNRLGSQFPASPLSNTGQDIARLGPAKTLLGPQPDQPLAPGTPLFGLAQKALPIFVQVFADRLARHMDLVQEEKLSRKFTEKEFRRIVLERVQTRFPGQLQEAEVHITPKGYVGSCKIRIGPFAFPVEGRIGITVVNERPHAVIHEIRVWNVPVMEVLRKQLENEANRTIDKLRLPLKTTEYETKEGYCWITVKRVR